MDHKLSLCSIFIDLRKAFDTVYHSILLEKLKHYGIWRIVNECFSLYLTNHTQTTQVGLEISDKAVTLSGVPGGSVLGPLLVLLYDNDMQKCPHKLKFYFFADDTNLLYADHNLKSL